GAQDRIVTPTRPPRPDPGGKAGIPGRAADSPKKMRGRIISACRCLADGGEILPIKLSNQARLNFTRHTTWHEIEIMPNKCPDYGLGRFLDRRE
ncbi:hypothetical protein P3W66_04440, partial [Achromobacter denitrificans]|uniref:hypothetical protein n=1 Tax=Achromobacter denitrificans TaxID=32002 RepID=UPI0023E42E5B